MKTMLRFLLLFATILLQLGAFAQQGLSPAVSGRFRVTTLLWNHSTEGCDTGKPVEERAAEYLP